jgi:hypothetical protein
MNKIACRVVPLVLIVLSACAGSAPPNPGPDDQLPDTGDPPPGEETAECQAAWECSDTCIEQQNCADTDTTCIDQCDMQCNVEQACANEPTDPNDPNDPTDPNDPAACDQAWQCSDDCGQQMNCADDEQCWLQCDAQCGVEQACQGTEPTDPNDPMDPPATCDEAWACSDECGAQQSCGYDEDCWLQCDEQCGVEQACAGEEGGY